MRNDLISKYKWNNSEINVFCSCTKASSIVANFLCSSCLEHYTCTRQNSIYLTHSVLLWKLAIKAILYVYRQHWSIAAEYIETHVHVIHRRCAVKIDLLSFACPWAKASGLQGRRVTGPGGDGSFICALQHCQAPKPSSPTHTIQRRMHAASANPALCE